MDFLLNIFTRFQVDYQQYEQNKLMYAINKGDLEMLISIGARYGFFNDNIRDRAY
jgi:hypothetical protein